jgi:hypothetical protein
MDETGISINDSQLIGYQYEFEICLISIKIDYKSQFNFKVLIKRGNISNDINRILKYDPYLDHEVPVNEEFSIVSVLNPMENCNFDFETNKIFHEKKYKIYICIYTKSGFKPAISGEINLSDYVNNDNDDFNDKEYIINLSNKTFNEVAIKFKVRSKYISEFDPISFKLNERNLNLEIEKTENEKLNLERKKTSVSVELDKGYINTLSKNRNDNILNTFFKEIENSSNNNNNNNNNFNKEINYNKNDCKNLDLEKSKSKSNNLFDYDKAKDISVKNKTINNNNKNLVNNKDNDYNNNNNDYNNNVYKDNNNDNIYDNYFREESNENYFLNNLI